MANRLRWMTGILEVKNRLKRTGSSSLDISSHYSFRDIVVLAEINPKPAP